MNETQVARCEAPDLEGASLNDEDGAGGVSAIRFAIINVSSSSCDVAISSASALTRSGDLRRLPVRDFGHFPLADQDTVVAAGDRLLGRLEYVVTCPGGALISEEVNVALILAIGERFIVVSLPDIESCGLNVVVAGIVPVNGPKAD